MKRPFLLVSLLALSAPLVDGCADLPAISHGTCGNAVLDPGEDCDSFATGTQSCRVAGQAGECRYDCGSAGDKPHTCPSGWGCGVDQICREPALTFSPVGSPIDSGGARLAMGDLDGDGRKDILSASAPDFLARSTVRVHYLDDSGGLAFTTAVPNLVGSPVVADISGDGIDDVIGMVGNLQGTQVFPGGRSRTLAPAAYPTLTTPLGSSTRIIAGPFRSGKFDEPLVFSTFLTATGKVHAVSPATLKDILLPLFTMHKGPDDLAGPVRVGTLVEKSPCPHIVFAFKDENVVFAYASCNANNPALFNFTPLGAAPDLIKVTLPVMADMNGMGPVGSGVHLGHANNDLFLDILVDPVRYSAKTGDKVGPPTPPGTTTPLFVAYGDGKGQFFPNPNLSGPVNTASTVTIPRDKPSLEIVLAVAKLDNDGVSDLVTSGGVYMTPTLLGSCSEKALETCVRGKNVGADWTEAAIGDFNRNGNLDVIVGSSGAVGLTVFSQVQFAPSGLQLGLFNSTNIATHRPVTGFAVGDYDGDFVQDLAFAQIAPAATISPDPATGDAISVLYGSASGPMQGPFLVGHLDRVAQIASANLVLQSFDFTSDLGIVSTYIDSANVEHQNVSVLFGGGERQLLAPFALQEVTTDTNVAARAATTIAPIVGQFTGDATLDLGVFALAGDSARSGEELRGAKVEFWLAESSAGARLSVPKAGVPLPLAFGDTPAPDFRTQLATGDLDGDGLAEIVYVTPRAAPPGTIVNQSDVFILSTKTGLAVTPAAKSFKGFVALDGRTLLVDLDKDGRQDLVLLTKTVKDGALTSRPDQIVDLVSGATEIQVFWGDGAGGFDFANPAIITPPQFTPPAKGAKVAPTAVVRTIPGIAVLPHGAERDLVITTLAVEKGTSYRHVLLTKRTGRTFTLLDLKIEGGSDVAIGDVTGDGVEDLAVITDGTLNIFAGDTVKR